MNNFELQKFVLGITLNIIVVKILKRFIRMPRPIMRKNSTFGMPSTRAATLTFIIVYLILVNKPSKKTIIMMVCAVLFLCSLKYIMKEHSLIQLAMGSLVGLTIGYLIYLIPGVL